MKYKPTTAANFFEDADGAAAVPLTKERPHYFATEISAGLSFLSFLCCPPSHHHHCQNIIRHGVGQGDGSDKK